MNERMNGQTKDWILDSGYEELLFITHHPHHLVGDSSFADELVAFVLHLIYV